MNELILLFLNNLLPIFLVAGFGYVAGKWLKVNPRTLSQLIFYIFSPCLLFTLIVDSRLQDQDILRTVGFTISLVVATGAIAWAGGRILKLERRVMAAVLLTSMFMNAGNYGLPLTNFAFGETALAFAGIFFVTNAIMTNTLGVVIASMGMYSLPRALVGLLKIPSVYAVILALGFVRLNLQLPLPFDRTVRLMGDASIPLMLLLLGVQFNSARWSGNLAALSLSNSLRLLVAPAIALLMVPLFGLQGPARQACVLEAAMPAAVLNTVLATEFDVEPSFVTFAVFIGTLISPLTLTPLLAYLGA